MEIDEICSAGVARKTALQPNHLGERGASMAERLAFTMARLAALKPLREGRRTVYDEKVSELTLTITETGGKSFYLYGRFSGRPRRIRIGGFPELTVDDARGKAVKLISRLAEGR